MIFFSDIAVCLGSLALRSADVTAIPSTPASRTRWAFSRFMPPAANMGSDVLDLAVLIVSRGTI